MKLNPCEVFKALGVETRLRIFELVKSRGPIGVKNISALIGITPAAVSQHLKILKQVGLVRNERKGYWIPYSINEHALNNCRGMMIEVCSCKCDEEAGLGAQSLGETDLRSLMKYEKEIERELKNVRKKISEIKSLGK